MTHYYNPILRRSKKERVCIFCGENILIGDYYFYQASVQDAKYDTSYFHPECFEDEDAIEFIPYENDRPERPWNKQPTTED